MVTSYACSLRLFGSMEVRRGDTVVSLRRKMRALLAYLAVTEVAQSRYALCELFFPETNDPLGALRWQLSQIRQSLGSEALLTDGERVQLNTQAVGVDALEFRRLLNRPPADLTLHHLQAAVDLYKGEFLEAMSVPDAPEFEVWLLGRRAEFHQSYTRALGQLLARLGETGQPEQALPYAERLVLSDPLLEEAHMRLIWLYAATGQREAALAQCDRCSAIMQRELAVEPTPECQTLCAEVRQGRLVAQKRIVAHTAITLHPPMPAPAVVGRDGEWERLQQFWRQASSGQGHVVLVEAEAGVGKTHLIRTFYESVVNTGVLAGQCYESTQTLPYSPWIELLETSNTLLEPAALQQLSSFALRQLAYLAPTLVDAARAALLAQAGDANQDHLALAIAEFIKAARRPLFLFVDDLQWADESSLQLFQRLAQRAPRLPLLLVGAFRPEETDANAALQTLLRDLQRSSTSRLSLTPLPPESVVQLVEILWPELPPGYRTHVCRLLSQSTGGNPFFITEIIRELRQSEGPATVLPIPESIRALIAGRLAKLPPGSRQVLEALSILGSPVALTMLQQASARSEDEAVNAIEIGLRWGMLAEFGSNGSTQYDFSHDLVRSAVATQMSAVRRQLLHRRAAEMLEISNAPAAVLTYHWALAGNPEKEGHYAILAGEQAAAIYANEEGVRYLARALPLLTSAERKIGVMCRIGELSQLLGRHRDAEATYQQALQAAEQATRQEAESLWARRAQARCQIALGRLMRIKGDYGQAQHYLESAKTLCQAIDDPKGLAQALGGIGAVHWSQLDRAAALSCFQEQLTIARRLADRQMTGSALGSMGVVYAEQGEYAQALECYLQRLQIDLELNDRLSLAKTIGNMGIVYAEQGEYDHALACYHCILQMMLELGDRQYICVAVGNMIEVYTALGQYALAERMAQAAISLGRTLNIPLYLCEYLYISAKLFAHQRRYEEAHTLNEEAITIASAIGQTDVQLPAHLLSVQLRLATGVVGRVEAQKELASLLAQWPEEHHQAAILYTLWQLDATAAHFGEQAAALYKLLYARTPNILYRRRYAEVTGSTLPPPQSVPAPPQDVICTPVDIEALLIQVGQQLAELESA